MFINKEDIDNYCNSCIYNEVKPSELLDYQLHDVTSTLSTTYKKIIYFAKFNLFAKQTRLLVASQNRIAQTLEGIIFVYKEMLNKFASQT